MPKLLLKFLLIGLMVHPVYAASTTPTASIPNLAIVGDTEPPSIPILVRPVDSAVTGDNHPEFVWKMSTDAGSNTIYYTLYLDGQSTYLGISGSGNSSGTGYTARIEGNEIKLLPSTALSDGIHHWYVTATDSSGNTSSSTTWGLTIDTTSPDILITDIDIYHNLSLSSNTPEVFENLSFDIAGPKDIYFTISAESWSTVTLQFYDTSNDLIAQSSWPVAAQGVIYPYQHLGIGTYVVAVSAVDPGGNATALPDFRLNVTQAQISVPLPALPGLPPSYNIPYSPLTIASLPATVSQITTRFNLSSIIIILLAVLLALLLIIVWYKKYNLILIDSKGNPLSNTIVYHSIPTYHTTKSHILLSKHDPISYELTKFSDGKLYVQRLGRYSTLTVRTTSATHILSMSSNQKVYRLVL